MGRRKESGEKDICLSEGCYAPMYYEIRIKMYVDFFSRVTTLNFYVVCLSCKVSVTKSKLCLYIQ